MAQTVIGEAKSIIDNAREIIKGAEGTAGDAQKIINKSKGKTAMYFRDSKEELFKPEKIVSISDMEYKKLYNMGLKNFNDANEKFKSANSMKVKIEELEKMINACDSLYSKYNKWQKYTIYRTELRKMRKLLIKYTEELEKSLGEKSKQLKTGNINELKDL